MKIIVSSILILTSLIISAQELETDTLWIESESKALFDEADQLTSIIYLHLELDYEIANLDTFELEDKIRKEIYIEQKEDLLQRALRIYEDLIDDFPTSKYYYKALNNKGIIEFELDLYNQSKKSFIEILNSDVNDSEQVRVGYGLMAEPYANYRRRAAEKLYEIEYKLDNFEKASQYLEESTKYQYKHFCGNAYEEKDFWLAYQRSKLETKFANYQEATRIMIPFLFNRRVMRDPDLANFCLELLTRDKSIDQLITEFDNAILKFHTKKNRPEDEYENYFITFMGEDIELNMYTPEDKSEEINKVRETVENQWIYQLIKSKK